MCGPCNGVQTWTTCVTDINAQLQISSLYAHDATFHLHSAKVELLLNIYSY